MIPQAPNKHALIKRVTRFFDSNTWDKAPINKLINALCKRADTYLFGGMIRDIGLFGLKKFKSDIDLVFDGDKRELLKAFNDAGIVDVVENKFGGFRVKNLKWDIDIWAVHDTWAFKKGLVDFNNVDSLLDTTLMTWDAVLFNLSTRELIAKNGYLEDLISGRLEIVLKENPNQIGTLVRILRAIFGKHAVKLGENLIKLILDLLDEFTPEQIINYEKLSYSQNYISFENLNFLERLLSTYPGKGDLILSSNNQLSLDL